MHTAVQQKKLRWSPNTGNSRPKTTGSKYITKQRTNRKFENKLLEFCKSKMATMKPVFMSDKRYDSICKRIQESYPYSCILYIDEVDNPELYKSYLERMESIRQERKEVQEMQLFHGTREENINAIAHGGFDPSKNVRSVYGYGTYFAKNARYSSEYMISGDSKDITYMFLADVLIGKTSTAKKLDTKEFDNNVDNIANPTIITTPYANGAYPRYIIAFHKNAK